jgi:hypothetical protein
LRPVTAFVVDPCQLVEAKKRTPRTLWTMLMESGSFGYRLFILFILCNACFLAGPSRLMSVS